MEQSNSIVIPEWTEDDFTNSTEPFEWLYQYKDNDFVMTQLRDRIRIEANSVGVRNFLSLWKAYLKAMSGNREYSQINATQFDGQPLELDCGKYKCDERVSYIDGYGSVQIVCRHPIMPIRRMENIDTHEQRLEIAYKLGNRWRTLITDRQTLASGQRIIDLSRYGIAVDSDNAKELVKFITFIEQQNYDKLGETNSVGRLGWISNYSFSPYMEDVRFDGDISFQNTYKAIEKCGDYQEWINVCKLIRGRGIIARIVLAASFASPLVRRVDMRPFFVHLWGGAGSGKTVGLMLAASVWANPSMGEYIHSFNSTAVGQEMVAGFLNSLPLIIDELQVVKDKKSFDQTIYMLSEGMGKSRGAKSGGTQKMQTWQNCILTTGEMPITTSTSGGGAVDRVVEIDCKDEQLFEDPRNVVSIITKNYGHAGPQFIEWVLKDGSAEIIHKEFVKAQTYFEQCGVTTRQAMDAALIITADYLAEKIIFKDGVVLTPQDLSEYLVTKDSMDVNRRALDWIYDFVASNPNKFTSDENNFGEVWGETDGEYLYIIKSIFDQKMTEAGFNSTSFLSWAKRNNLLKTDSDGKRTTKKRKIRGSQATARFVCLAKTMAENTDDDVESDELPF